MYFSSDQLIAAEVEVETEGHDSFCLFDLFIIVTLYITYIHYVYFSSF